MKSNLVCTVLLPDCSEELEGPLIAKLGIHILRSKNDRENQAGQGSSEDI